MTNLQEVLFKLDAPYHGHPYFVTGHALYTALARRVDDRVRRALAVSHGVFVPGEFGSYPPWHSQSGGVPYLGTGLRPVEAYEDLFLFREQAQRWLSASRPRDAHNTFDIQHHDGRVAMKPAVRFGRPPEKRNTKRTMSWYVHCYLHSRDATAAETVLPVAEETLDGLRVGGARNYGFGRLALEETRTIDIKELSYQRVREADALQLELVTPYVLRSEYPDADDQTIPWWWAPETPPDDDDASAEAAADALRRRATRLAEGAETYRVVTVDHGQVVGYAGSDPVRTAKNGLRRVGTHSRFGFGELRVRPADDDRVPEREPAAYPTDTDTTGASASTRGDAQ